jgi:hypothetical protein
LSCERIVARHDLGSEPSRRAVALLALGAAVGLLFAALGLLGRHATDAALPAGAVASVNGELILREDFERMLAAFARDRREPLDASDRRHVLDRLIDEELLVQRGIDLGLSRHDRRVRADLTSAVIASVISESDGGAATRPELEDFYREYGDFFTRPGRMRVQQVFVRPGDAARGTAEEAARRLRQGEALERVAEELGSQEVAPLPDTALPALKLREYLGPTATRTLLGMQVGEVSDPVRSGMGFHVLRLVAREPDRRPELGEIEDEVRAEYRRRSGDRALRDYLDQLRRDADLRLEANLQ